MALSKFKAVKMGSEHFLLMRAAVDAPNQTLARDFRRRADVVKQALLMHGWRLLSDDINVERNR